MRILQNHPQLEVLGLRDPNKIFWQLNTPQLYEQAIRRHEAFVAHLGPIVVRTGNNTSLSHHDRYIVAEPPVQSHISWSEINRPYDSQQFDRLLSRVTAYFHGMDVFVQDSYVRTDTDRLLPFRFITETAWHNLFVRNMYLHEVAEKLEDFRPEYTVIHAPGFRAIPARDGTSSDVFVMLHLTKKLILIGGTSHAGEIMKAVFSVMNYLLPRQGTLTMEGAANIGAQNDVVLFMGIAGTGKTTLATDNTRHLIGEAELGWSDTGVFSLGRGGYAKALGLSADVNPYIYETTRRFGTILENVSLDVSNRHLDLDDALFTDNTRASYPLTHIPNSVRDGAGGHPKHVILLTKDVTGVLPPVSKLTPDQAHYHFLSGYTGQLVQQRDGTLAPQITFSACYDAPFMPLHPGYYARLFHQKVREHGTHVWLVNTGWYGGTYHTGKRISLADTRAIVRAILSDELNTVDTVKEPYFQLAVPLSVEGVSLPTLNPAEAWSSQTAYEAEGLRLTEEFDANFNQYRGDVDPARLAVQPDMG